MNYMSEVVEMLNLKFGEVFRVTTVTGEYVEGYFFITEDGFRKVGEADAYYPMVGMLIITGSYIIIPEQYIPKRGEKYFFVHPNDYIGDTCWYGDVDDINFYKLGNCFRTESEITPEIMNKYVSFYNNDDKHCSHCGGGLV